MRRIFQEDRRLSKDSWDRVSMRDGLNVDTEISHFAAACDFGLNTFGKINRNSLCTRLKAPSNVFFALHALSQHMNQHQEPCQPTSLIKSLTNSSRG